MKHVETNIIMASKCQCNNGFCVDRYRNGKEMCPACDPKLGNTKEIRLHNYNILLSTPMKELKENES